MQWFKHDSDANADAKLQNVLLDYGLEGYGLYWYCVELIVGRISIENVTFQLEHDARIIARNTGSTPQKVEEMMRYFVKVGLFEESSNFITCMSLAKRLDKSMTSNPRMREIIGKTKIGSHDTVMTVSDSVMQDKIRLDKNRINILSTSDNESTVYEKKKPSFSYDKNEIIQCWNDKADKHGLPRIRIITDTVGKRLKKFYDKYKKCQKELGKETRDATDIICRFIEAYEPSPYALGQNPAGKKHGIEIAFVDWFVDQELAKE